MKNKFVYLVTIILAVLYLAAGHYFAVQGLSFLKRNRLLTLLRQG